MIATPVPAQYDILGSEIKIGSYVVAGTGVGSLIIAQVTDLKNLKYGGWSESRVRADITIVLSEALIEYRAHPYGHAPKLTTHAGISNLIVITPDMQQLTMIQKLTI